MRCNRKFPTIGSAVEESIGASREAIKLVRKVSPYFKHFTGTTHEMSKDSHGAMRESLGRSGKRNAFLGSARRAI